MTLQEYKNRLKESEEKHRAEIRALRIEFALKNATSTKGDIVTDHMGSIRVEAISCGSYGDPQTVYYGIELKKDLTPRKDGAKRWVYQSNLKIQ